MWNINLILKSNTFLICPDDQYFYNKKDLKLKSFDRTLNSAHK